MKVLIDGKEYDLTPDGDGLVSVTFTKQDKSPISIGALEDCAGATVIDNIQLEQADKATAYEDPALIQGEATGLIKDIRGLEYAINDPVNGLRSQLTILAQGFEAEVADAIGNYSVQGQTIDGLFSEIKSIDGNLNQLVRNAEGNNQLISSLQNDVAQNRLDYHSLKETADSYERIIGSSQGEFENNVSRAVQTSGLIQQEVASLTSGLSTTVSQLENSWIMELKDENDIKAALNATTDGLRLKGDLIHLTGTTAVDGDFWAKEINSIQINADNITGGTADFSKIKAINLDVNNLSGNRADLVSSGFLSASGGSLELNGDQILSTASDGSQTSIGTGRVNFRNPDGANLGGIGYEDYGASPYLTLRTSWGSHFRITARQEVSAGNVIDKHVLTVTAGKEMYLNTDNTYVTGDMTMQKAVRVGGHLSLSGGEVNQLSRVRFAKGAYLEEQVDGNVQLKSAGTQLQFYQASGRIMYSDGTRLFLDLSINMQGNGVLNQSDARMKTDIRKIEQDSLSIIKDTDFVNYKMISNGRETFGFIAQQMQKVAPHLIKDEDGTLAFDTMEWTQTVAHGLQQLDNKVDEEIAQLKSQIASLQDELALLKGDKK